LSQQQGAPATKRQVKQAKKIKTLFMPDGTIMRYDTRNYQYAITGIILFLIMIAILATGIIQGLAWISGLATNETASLWIYMLLLMITALFAGYFLGEADTQSITRNPQ
jgi:hypothetical protein